MMVLIGFIHIVDFVGLGYTREGVNLDCAFHACFVVLVLSIKVLVVAE